MTSLTIIVEEAYSRIGSKAEGQALSSDKGARGLRVLNDLIDGFPQRGVGDTLTTRRVDQAYTVVDPSILHVISTGALTITFPLKPHDGYRVKIVDVGTSFATNNVTVDRNGWLIAGSASDVTLATNGQSKEYFFRADLGDWKDITQPLSGGDDVPYPVAHDDGLSAILAKRLTENMGKEVTLSLAQAANDGLSRLQTEYLPDLTSRLEYALYKTPSHIPRDRDGEFI